MHCCTRPPHVECTASQGSLVSPQKAPWVLGEVSPTLAWQKAATRRGETLPLLLLPLSVLLLSALLMVLLTALWAPAVSSSCPCCRSCERWLLVFPVAGAIPAASATAASVVACAAASAAAAACAAQCSRKVAAAPLLSPLTSRLVLFMLVPCTGNQEKAPTALQQGAPTKW